MKKILVILLVTLNLTRCGLKHYEIPNMIPYNGNEFLIFKKLGGSDTIRCNYFSEVFTQVIGNKVYNRKCLINSCGVMLVPFIDSSKMKIDFNICAFHIGFDKGFNGILDLEIPLEVYTKVNRNKIYTIKNKIDSLSTNDIESIDWSFKEGIISFKMINDSTKYIVEILRRY